MSIPYSVISVQMFRDESVQQKLFINSIKATNLKQSVNKSSSDYILKYKLCSLFYSKLELIFEQSSHPKTTKFMLPLWLHITLK